MLLKLMRTFEKSATHGTTNTNSAAFSIDRRIQRALAAKLV